MAISRIIQNHWLSILFLFSIVNISSSLPQGTDLPYMTSDVEQVSGMSFDYIVVGGGTSGCPLAATLSEKFSVLLIERGSSPYGNPLITDRKLYGYSLLQTDKFSSVAQNFISQDGVQNCRGRVLGGSSAINGGFYSRASDDFVKRVGWDMELVEDCYKWVESKIVSIPQLSQWQYAIAFGLLEAGLFPYNGYSFEHMEGTKIGGSLFDEGGERRTSADLLKAGNASNVIVLLNTTVTNVIFHSNDDKNETKVSGIRFIKSDGSTNQSYEAYLKQPYSSCSGGDVILSAGALGSPQILLLSGIGPKQHLKSFNIPVVLDLKGVGEEMQDNPGIAVLADTIPQNRQPEPPQVAAISSNFKFIIEGGVIPTSFNGTTRMPIAAKIAFPESKGYLQLNSTDPRENPSVRFNYLTKEEDMEECMKMVPLLEHVAKSPAVSFFLGMQPQNKLVMGKDEVRKFCKENVRTYFHFHGGCRVGSVVDNDFRVYGVKGLRVVDGSTLLESPGTNPMATLLMLGRYQGIKILHERENEKII